MCLFAELTAERRKIRLPDKLHIYPGYRHGAVSGHGCPTWGVSCHSRGDLFLCSMTKLCTPTTSSMGNISVFEGQGVWNVCLRCPHLRDRSGLCQVGYFCDHGKRHLCIWILPGRPIKMMKRLPHWKIQIQLSKHLQIQIQISSGLMQINNQAASQQNRVADDGG